MIRSKIDQVVIMAGGLGSRLRPITLQVPKVLVDVNGRPFLHYQLEYLKKEGYKKILLLVSYLGRQVEAAFGSGRQYGIEIDYNYEPEPMGTGGALKLAETKLDKYFILINGDTFMPLDYEAFLSRMPKMYDGYLVIYDNIEKISQNNILVSEDGKVTAYSIKDTNDKNGIYAGISVWSKKMLNMIPNNSKISLEDDIFPKLIKTNKLWGYLTKQRFYDIGTFERLEIIKQVIK